MLEHTCERHVLSLASAEVAPAAVASRPPTGSLRSLSLPGGNAMTVPSCRRPLTGLGALLPHDAWAELLALGSTRRFRAGDTLLHEGVLGTYVLALAEGRVIITKASPDGEEMIMAIGDPGEILGDMTVLDQSPRSATVTALTQCTTHVLSSEQFRLIINRHAAVEIMARHAFVRMREAELARFEMSTLPVAQRLACAMVRLMTRSSDWRIELSQDQLARLVGASRNTIVGALGELRARGVIKTSRRRLMVTDPQLLLELAAGNPAARGTSHAV
jgi:CRP/FNR family transcriptional regulator, cyclic AMP receptor protein